MSKLLEINTKIGLGKLPFDHERRCEVSLNTAVEKPIVGME